MTKNRFLLLGLMLTILIIIGVTLISSNSPFSSTISPESESPLNTASPAPTPSTPTPSAPPGSKKSSDQPFDDYESLLEYLRGIGVKVKPNEGQIGPPMSPVDGRVILLTEEKILGYYPQLIFVLVYENPGDAASDASLIGPDGKFPGSNFWGVHSYYLKDNLLVLHTGNASSHFFGSKITRALESVLGPPFLVGDPQSKFLTGEAGRPDAQLPPITLTSDFKLTVDVVFRENGFIITADNITIDLNGHTIIGQGKGDGILVEGRKGVTIQNGVISRFTNAIRLSDSDGNVIQNITFLGGIVIDGDHNEVSRNKMREYGVGTTTQPPFRNDVGITINGSNNKVLNNTVTSTGEYIVGVHGNNNEISSNMIDIGGNFKVGPTALFINGSQNVLTDNTIRGETRITGMGNVFSKNLAKGKVILDGANKSIISDNGGSGPGFTLSIELGYENLISNNSGFEISILAGSGNVVRNNNIGAGLFGPGVTIRSDGNEFSGNSVTYVYSDGSSYGPVQEQKIVDISGNDNMVSDNTITGTLVITGERNIIVMNNFMFRWSQFHARDDGMNNIWHRNGNGNYWAGIFDNPYKIPGKAQSSDRFPVRTPY